MKKRNWFIAVVVVLSLMLVLLLPVFLSSGRIQSLLLERANRQIPGTLSFERCSIGWQQGLRCTGVAYNNGQQGIQIKAPMLNGSQGLLALIVASGNLGTVSLDDPVLVLPGVAAALLEENSAAPKHDLPRAGSQKDAGEDSAGAAVDAVPLWDRLNVRLQTAGAVVKLANDTLPPETFIRYGSLDARLAAGTVTFELDLESPDGQGAAQASGFVNLPARQGALADTLVAEIRCNLKELQVEPYLALLPGQLKLPRGRGELSSDLLVKAAGTSNLQISGNAVLRNVALQGGFLGDDQPEFKRAGVELNVQRSAGKGWQLSALKLSSDFGEVEATGHVDGRDFTVNAEGKLEVPVLIAQLPHLFHAQPKTSLEGGSMDFVATLARDQQRLEVAAAVVVEDIQGSQSGRPFSWNSRVELNLDGSMTDKETRIGRLTVKAPFVDLEGAGDLRAFSLQGTADLGLAVQEIGKIFLLNWDGGGRLDLKAESKEKSENRYVVSADVKIADFSLSHQGKAVVPPHQLTFTGRMETPGRLPHTRSEAMGLVFELAAWPGRVKGKLDKVYHKGERISAAYHVQSDLQLGRLTDLLHNIDILDRDTTLTGSMNLQAAGYSEDGRLVVRELDSRVHDLIFYENGKIFQDSLLHVFTTQPVVEDEAAGVVRPLELVDNEASFFAGGGGNTMLDAVRHRIVLRDLGVTSDLGSLDVNTAAVNDWQQFPATLSLKLNGTADLAELTPVLQQYALLASGQAIGGTGSFGVDLAPGRDQEHSGSVTIDIENGSVSEQEKPLLTARQVRLRTRLQGNLSSGDIDFDRVDFQSPPLSVQASGRLQRSGPEPYFSLTGTAAPDFSSLAVLVNDLYATDVRAAGGGQEQFRFYYPLDVSDTERYTKMQFGAALHAAYVSHFGIDLQQLALQAGMEKGVLQAALTGKVNNGRLALSPRLDFTQTPPLITLPEAEQVLTDVLIERALVDGLLKRINPVFGLLATPTGSFSARLDRFSWPLPGRDAGQGDFSMVLNVSKVKLSADGVLHEILAMVGLGDEPLTLKQSEITCNGAEARINCTPLKIMVADSEMILNGSVGFDGSLDYLLQVPVTEKLVGREGYRVLKGTTLKVPVRGSSEQAVFDADALSDAVSDLLSQAAGKAIEEQMDKILPSLLDGIMGK